ncbi:AAA family ATPase [Streptomyces sp. NBC_00996]|uniref:AAA family ATPase n=1 Tax=Streptomyces sp. NBC_00996 TaxID=2903710 RepID=UPI003867562A|nr:AAA family ATPase [Streptomyces sp. NBC_00996]
MYLHHLTVQAFGPFARTEDVDFDALTSAGLFLLRGDTGAGKTSILDAVCFALYGTVPGIRPTHRLRSDHAPVDTRTWVVLEFSAAGRRLRITRTPKQTYPSARAKNGTATAEATVQLHERTVTEQDFAAWEPVCAKHEDACREIEAALGLPRNSSARSSSCPRETSRNSCGPTPKTAPPCCAGSLTPDASKNCRTGSPRAARPRKKTSTKSPPQYSSSANASTRKPAPPSRRPTPPRTGPSAPTLNTPPTLAPGPRTSSPVPRLPKPPP